MTQEQKPIVYTLWYWTSMVDSKGEEIKTWSDECQGTLGECLSQVALDNEEGHLMKWQITTDGPQRLYTFKKDIPAKESDYTPYAVIMSGDID